VRFVEVLFTDRRCAAKAHAAVGMTPVGDAALQLLVVEDVATYDRLASLRHSLAFPGTVLGAMLVGLGVGLVLAIASLFPSLELDLATVYFGSVVAFAYGALMGLIMGSQAPAPGPRAMRRGLAQGKAVVRITVVDLASAMLAHDLLARQAGAERSFGD
jgi:hypothetical protein